MLDSARRWDLQSGSVRIVRRCYRQQLDRGSASLVCQDGARQRTRRRIPCGAVATGWGNKNGFGREAGGKNLGPWQNQQSSGGLRILDLKKPTEYRSLEGRYEISKRRGSRLLALDEHLASLLWSRLSPHLEPAIQTNHLSTTPLCFSVDGTWALHGVNPGMRINLYEPDADFFGPHVDAQFCPSADESPTHHAFGQVPEEKLEEAFRNSVDRTYMTYRYGSQFVGKDFSRNVHAHTRFYDNGDDHDRDHDDEDHEDHEDEDDDDDDNDGLHEANAPHGDHDHGIDSHDDNHLDHHDQNHDQNHDRDDDHVLDDDDDVDGNDHDNDHDHDDDDERR
ncbi:hypothetical protein HDU96_009641 [Phlyctochytrium bullatum]|nr:hypothetical protein HDU96_009641 [Phlyctochytrium bullatum]